MPEHHPLSRAYARNVVDLTNRAIEDGTPPHDLPGVLLFAAVRLAVDMLGSEQSAMFEVREALDRIEDGLASEIAERKPN